MKLAAGAKPDYIGENKQPSTNLKHLYYMVWSKACPRNHLQIEVKIFLT